MQLLALEVHCTGTVVFSTGEDLHVTDDATANHAMDSVDPEMTKAAMPSHLVCLGDSGLKSISR